MVLIIKLNLATLPIYIYLQYILPLFNPISITTNHTIIIIILIL